MSTLLKQLRNQFEGFKLKEPPKELVLEELIDLKPELFEYETYIAGLASTLLANAPITKKINKGQDIYDRAIAIRERNKKLNPNDEYFFEYMDELFVIRDLVSSLLKC